MTQAICDEFFSGHSANQRWKLADNTVLALRAYGLLEDDGSTPTQLARDLRAVADQPEAFYDRFAKHILTDLRGIDLAETLVAMQSANEEINLHTLHRRLEQRGLHVPRGAVHLSSMRLWLALAGVFDPAITGGARLYEVNQSGLRRILGLGLDSIDALTQLNRAQRAFLRALAHIVEPDPLIANRVADLASTLYGVEYNHKELPKSILFPLRDLGYVQLTKSTTGRGAKPYEVQRTPKFREEISERILAAVAEKAGLVPKELFEWPLSRILDDLKSPTSDVKGKALELLAIYLTRLIDLDFKGWRVRSSDTGGAEVDAVVEGARLVFSRWQIQAKNTTMVHLDDVAKEVGLALTFIYSDVVMVVTTGSFTRDTYSYVRHVMKSSNLNIILLDRSDLKRICQEPTSIVTILNSKAEQAMKVKERADYFAAA